MYNAARSAWAPGAAGPEPGPPAARQKSFRDIPAQSLTEKDIRRECRRLFRALDGDGDGVLTKLELIKGIRGGEQNETLAKVKHACLRVLACLLTGACSQPLF